MSNEKTGGPAYPRTGEGFGNPIYDTPGMTLLDHFAGMAMQGQLSAVPLQEEWPEHVDIASRSYKYAAAMIAERIRIMNEKP